MSTYSIKQLYTAGLTQDLCDVTVNGWVRTMRQSKTFAFVELNDGSFFRTL